MDVLAQLSIVLRESRLHGRSSLRGADEPPLFASFIVHLLKGGQDIVSHFIVAEIPVQVLIYGCIKVNMFTAVLIASGVT